MNGHAIYWYKRERLSVYLPVLILIWTCLILSKWRHYVDLWYHNKTLKFIILNEIPIFSKYKISTKLLKQTLLAAAKKKSIWELFSLFTFTEFYIVWLETEKDVERDLEKVVLYSKPHPSSKKIEWNYLESLTYYPGVRKSTTGKYFKLSWEKFIGWEMGLLPVLVAEQGVATALDSPPDPEMFQEENAWVALVGQLWPV